MKTDTKRQKSESQKERIVDIEKRLNIIESKIDTVINININFSRKLQHLLKSIADMMQNLGNLHREGLNLLHNEQKVTREEFIKYFEKIDTFTQKVLKYYSKLSAIVDEIEYKPTKKDDKTGFA